MNLQNLRLRFCYDSGPDDLANDFYIPCLTESVSYDRAVGFFSSSIYEISWKGLRKFLSNQGRIRLVCSHVLQEKDVLQISKSLSEAAHIVETELIREVDKLMANSSHLAAVQVLGYLVATERLKIKIAIPHSAITSNSFSIFHSKTGIFKDLSGSTVVFKGSSNESKSAFSLGGNSETVDVFCSWINKSEQKRIAKAQSDFESLWANTFEDVTVMDFPEATRQKLIRVSSEDLFQKALASFEDQVVAGLPTVELLEPSPLVKNKYSLEVEELREHQKNALMEWVENKHIGLMEHATGSGKTITGIAATVGSLNDGIPTVILVPSKLLLTQWIAEVKKYIEPNPPILVCGDGHVDWKNGNLRNWLSEPSNARVVISTVATASSSDFTSQLSGLGSWTVIADEVHRMGSQRASHFLDLNPKNRLGLSATPTRVGDPVGTQRIESFFGKILPTKFGLLDAIRLKILTPYHYTVKTVELTESEMERWIFLSKRIAILRNNASKPGDGNDSSGIERLLIERFRIVKGAENKIIKAFEFLRDRYAVGDRWIVYCDTIDQLEILYEKLLPLGITVSKYYSSMEGDSAQTLKYFERVGGIILSVRCLDEGVDIPAASHALLIASSQNPREFIQRRGRILRKSPGKTISYICDLITLPSADFEDSEIKSSMRFILSELSRAILFAKDAVNSNAAADIERIANRFEIDLKINSEEGIETDFEEDTDG